MSLIDGWNEKANLLFIGLSAREFVTGDLVGTPRDWPSHSICTLAKPRRGDLSIESTIVKIPSSVRSDLFTGLLRRIAGQGRIEFDDGSSRKIVEVMNG